MHIIIILDRWDRFGSAWTWVGEHGGWAKTYRSNCLAQWADLLRSLPPVMAPIECHQIVAGWTAMTSGAGRFRQLASLPRIVVDSVGWSCLSNAGAVAFIQADSERFEMTMDVRLMSNMSLPVMKWPAPLGGKCAMHVRDQHIHGFLAGSLLIGFGGRPSWCLS